MKLAIIAVVASVLIKCAFSQQGAGKNGNLRLCVVEGKGSYKKGKQYCPILERSNVNVECVIGIDRTDCLRKITKGTADFGVFTSEDLEAAAWKNLDILITNELRFHPDNEFDYEVVAIVDNNANIKSIEDLRGTRLCHPGYGYDADWTDVMANYFETRVIPRSCETSMSLLENKLKASSEFFSGACKAGPWVPDKERDRILKSFYPNLCSQCYDPGSCSNSDKYWGRKGPLYCITEEAGDIAWIRLDDLKLHFGFVGNSQLSNPEGFSYLCPDGTTLPLKNSTKPCVWIAKPWPVVGASRKVAADVTRITKNLTHDNKNSWQSALLSLIQFYNSRLFELRPQKTINDYLKTAVGFLSANSYAECPQPRSIAVCTRSILERSKCDWLSETAKAYGVEPHLQCVNPPNNPTSMSTYNDACFEEVQKGRAEVAFGISNSEVVAYKKYGLEPFLYEMTHIKNDLTVVMGVVKKNSTIKTFNDLKGKDICMGKHNGIVWNSVVHYLKSKNLLNKDLDCNSEAAMSEFFNEGCVPDLPGYPDLTAKCDSKKTYETKDGPLRCLLDGKADVAFLFLNDIKYNSDDYAEMKPDKFQYLCPPETKSHCFIGWGTLGQLYARKNTTDVRHQELINTFKRLDQLFGKYYKSQTSDFMMYGPFDHKNNVLFHDNTKFLFTYSEVANQKLLYNYEIILNERHYETCGYQNAASKNEITIFMLLISAMLSLFTLI